MTKEEVRSAFESLAKGKALGIDDILIELLKSIGKSAIDVMAILCQKIWTTTEWLQDWKQSVYLPLPKKGDSRECSNNRTIALLTKGSKVLLQILQWRLEPYMEREMPVEQAGFQKGRGTRDHITNLRWLMEVSSEYQKNVYLCFIDYSKAFDCTDHNRLWLSLRSMGIAEHLIVLMKNLYEGQEATVCTSHGDTEWFGIGKGVQQGCILSPYLFNLYAEKIMCKAELDEDGLEVRVGRLMLTNLWYSDDTILMAESSEDLKMLITKVKEESANAGLFLNIKKTKVMMTDDTSEFQMDGDKIEVVQSFNFLGSLVNKDSTSSEEIKRRLNLARVAMVKLKYLMKSSRLNKESKIKMGCPIAMYGCESWTIRKQDRCCIDLFELWCWRGVLKIPWTKKETKKSVVQKICPESSLEAAIVKQRLKYFGHIMRKDSSLEKILMLARCDGQ